MILLKEIRLVQNFHEIPGVAPKNKYNSPCVTRSILLDYSFLIFYLNYQILPEGNVPLQFFA